MPLPNIANGTARQCTAKNRKTGNRCLNPAAFGMGTCRYHGARKPSTVRHGDAHPQYKHGLQTLGAKRHRTESLARLSHIEAGLWEKGLLLGSRTRGRKPGTVTINKDRRR